MYFVLGILLYPVMFICAEKIWVKFDKYSAAPNDDWKARNGTVKNNYQQEREVVPNYSLSRFHRLISDGAAPTYRINSRAGIKNIHQYTPRVFYYDPAPRRIAKTVQISTESSKTGNYPIPEDRLPSVDIITVNEELPFRDSNLSETKTKSRSARFVKNFADKAKIPPWNRGSGMAYAPQQDLYMYSPSMKDVADRHDYFVDHDTFDKDVPSVLHESLPILLAAFLPLSMMVAAVVPIMIKHKLSGGGDIPLITTTATGNRTLTESNLQLLASIGKFSPRNLDEDCITRVFCKMVNADELATLALRETISELSTYLDDDFMDTFGLRTVVEILKDGKCEKIKCY